MRTQRLPADLVARRARPPSLLLRASEGVELATADSATPVPNDVTVRLVRDGERLAGMRENSVDFILGNRVLEHCADRLAMLRRHLAIVRPAGWLFYAFGGSDSGAWLAFVTDARAQLDGAFECRYFEFTGDETLCVLRRAA